MDKSVKQRLIPSTQKAVILLHDCFTRKSGGPSTRSAAHLHISHEIARISQECPEDFLRPAKFFDERYSKVKMIITRKIARKLTRTSKEKSRLP